MPTHSACIVVAYFGKLPATFDHWLASCAKNPQYDWIVFTDDARERRLPPNVRIEICSFDDCKRRIAERVGVMPEPMTVYKLCDYKPTYGVLYEEYLEDYDYWGFCDLDMVFGDIERLQVQARMGDDEVLQGQGHLAFYRNSEAGRNYFRLKAPDLHYTQVLKIQKAVAFDEWRGVPALCISNEVPYSHNYTYADIMPGIPRFRMFYTEENARHQVFAWEDGRVLGYHLRDGEVEVSEYGYIHIQKRAMPVNDAVPGQSFWLTPKGFRHKATSGSPTIAELRRLARPPLVRRLRHLARRLTRPLRPSPKEEVALPRQAFHV